MTVDVKQVRIPGFIRIDELAAAHAERSILLESARGRTAPALQHRRSSVFTMTRLTTAAWGRASRSRRAKCAQEVSTITLAQSVVPCDQAAARKQHCDHHATLPHRGQRGCGNCRDGTEHHEQERRLWHALAMERAQLQ